MHAPHLCCRPLTVSPPKEDEVIVRVEAAPINPSDLGLLLATGDVSLAKVSGKGRHTVVTVPIAPAAMRTLSARIAAASNCLLGRARYPFLINRAAAVFRPSVISEEVRPDYL